MVSKDKLTFMGESGEGITGRVDSMGTWKCMICFKIKSQAKEETRLERRLRADGERHCLAG